MPTIASYTAANLPSIAVSSLLAVLADPGLGLVQGQPVEPLRAEQRVGLAVVVEPVPGGTGRRAALADPGGVVLLAAVGLVDALPDHDGQLGIGGGLVVEHLALERDGRLDGGQ